MKLMDPQEEIEQLKKEGFSADSLPKMAKATAAMLDQGAIGFVAKVFNDPKFQKLAEFEKRGQLEKDRIFNELIIAPLTLFMLTLEAPDIRQPEEFRDYLLTVRDEIPKTHVEYLKSLGIEKKHLADWEKLIKMRYEEYRQDKLEARGAMMEFEAGEKGRDLTSVDLEEINLFLPAFTVAVGCHQHICRGKTKGKDELFKYMVENLSRFYTEFRVAVEGGKITPWQKAKVKFRHFWNGLKEK